MALTEFTAGTKISSDDVNGNFTFLDGRIDTVAGDVSDLQDAPPAHADTHKSGGADQLYRTGSVSVTTDGNGSASTSVAHGLGATPSVAFVNCPSALTQQARATSWDGTNLSIALSGGAGFTAYTVQWAVLL